MTTTTAVWTENTNLHTSGTVAAAASATDDIDIDNLAYLMVSVTIEILFGGSPDGDVDIEVFGSNDSGTQDDTEPILSFKLSEATSTTKRRTFQIMGVPYIAVKITNNDTTDTVTYDSWYSGLKLDNS